jgi:hypothetical protein
MIYGIALAITCTLFLRLGPYPYPAPERARDRRAAECFGNIREYVYIPKSDRA